MTTKEGDKSIDALDHLSAAIAVAHTTVLEIDAAAANKVEEMFGELDAILRMLIEAQAKPQAKP